MISQKRVHVYNCVKFQNILQISQNILIIRLQNHIIEVGRRSMQVIRGTSIEIIININYRYICQKVTKSFNDMISFELSQAP